MSELFSLHALHKHAVHLSWPYFGKPESKPQKKNTHILGSFSDNQTDLHCRAAHTKQHCLHKAMLLFKLTGRLLRQVHLKGIH